MTVVFDKQSLFPLSNKQESKTTNVKEVVYTKKIAEGHTLYFIAPRIDRMTMTLPVKDPEDQKGIMSLLVNAVKDPDSGLTNGPLTLGWTAGYQHKFLLTDPQNGGAVLIQAKPKKVGTAFLRLEFMPGILNEIGMAYFKTKAIQLFGPDKGYGHIATSGKVTRVDVACDIVNCSIRDTIIRHKDGGKSHLYFGTDEEVETVYLAIKKNAAGKNTSSSHYAYNKRQDYYDKNQPPRYDGAPCTRIEARVTTMVPIIKLAAKIPNPLTKFELHYPPLATAPESEHHWAFFADSCRHRGIDNAISLLPDLLRPIYSVALESAKTDFWNAGALWEHWPHALERAGLN